MKTEFIHSLTLAKIGFGTWKTDGDTILQPEWFKQSMAAFRSDLEIDYTHFDTKETELTANKMARLSNT